MKIALYGLGLLGLLLLLAYGTSTVKKSEIKGVYVANYSFGVEKINLKADGIYFQQMTVNGDQKTYEKSGAWKFDPETNYITIENCYIIADGFGKLRKDYSVPSNGLSLLPVWRHIFSRKIYIGTDELTPYIKIGNL